MGDYHGIITDKCSPGKVPDLEIQDLLEEIANQAESGSETLDLFIERPIPFRMLSETFRASDEGYLGKIQEKFGNCWTRGASCRYRNTRFHSADIRVSSAESFDSVQFFYTPTKKKLINVIFATEGGGAFPLIDEEDVLVGELGGTESIDRQDEEENDTYIRRLALQYISNLQRLPDTITTRVVKQFDKLRAENFTGDQYSYLLSIRDDILDGFNVDSSLYKLSLARPELVSGLVYLMNNISEELAELARDSEDDEDFNKNISKVTDTGHDLASEVMDNISEELAELARDSEDDEDFNKIISKITDTGYDLAARIGPFVKQIPLYISRMMDYYLLARMFGKGYGRNAIIYAGDNHASFLINFLKERGFEVDYTSGPPRYNPPRQCAIYHSKTILSKRDREEDREEPPVGKRTKK
jgi:hypothetical protein